MAQVSSSMHFTQAALPSSNSGSTYLAPNPIKEIAKKTFADTISKDARKREFDETIVAEHLDSERSLDSAGSDASDSESAGEEEPRTHLKVDFCVSKSPIWVFQDDGLLLNNLAFDRENQTPFFCIDILEPTDEAVNPKFDNYLECRHIKNVAIAIVKKALDNPDSRKTVEIKMRKFVIDKIQEFTVELCFSNEMGVSQDEVVSRIKKFEAEKAVKQRVVTTQICAKEFERNTLSLKDLF